MDTYSTQECLDLQVCQEMEKLAEVLTTSGKPVLNVDLMKKFKRICRYMTYMSGINPGQFHCP